MDAMQLFDHLPIWLVFIATAVVFIIAVEFGFRIGLYKFAHRDAGQKSQVGTIMQASLALLAFFMAFTFGMASSRQDARKSLLLVLSAVLILIIDIERPAQSIFNVSQRAMIELSTRINPQ